MLLIYCVAIAVMTCISWYVDWILDDVLAKLLWLADCKVFHECSSAQTLIGISNKHGSLIGSLSL